MPRFLHWTDIHAEFAPFDIPTIPEGIDAILLGGDQDVGMRSLELVERVWDATGVPVVFVIGNHEYYGHEVGALHARLEAGVAAAQANGKAIAWLRGDAIEIAGVRIIGATLWTDMALLGPSPAGLARIGLGMNDYRRIGVREPAPLDADVVMPPKIRALTISDTIGWHQQDRNAIFGHLSAPYDGPTVVLTHHLPSPLCIAQRFRGDALNPAFASDMTQNIASSSADWWFYGHSHGPVEHDLVRKDGGICRLRSNCRGYPSEWGHTGFDPLRVFDIPTKRG